MRLIEAPHAFDAAAVRLALAALLALPVGSRHVRGGRSVGLRAYPLLSACVCGFLLVAQRAAWGAREQADALYGVLNGIGFVGSGALIKSRTEVSGMSTSVSLWVTGAIGAGVSFGQPLVSAAVSVMSVLALWGPSLFGVRRTSA